MTKKLDPPALFNGFKEWVFDHPDLLRKGFNLWPPFLLAGITIEEIADDYKSARLKLGWSKLTLNINGTQFGGSMFAMSDPMYVTLLFGILGREKYYIWDKEASINYIRPGMGPIYFEPILEQKLIEEILEKTASGDKFEPVIKDQLYDSEGRVVAEVTRKLYIRLKPEFRPKS